MSVSNVRVVSNGTVLDPKNDFEKLLISIVKLHRAKSHDYASEEDPYQNYVDSGIQANINTGQAVESRLGEKQSRLKQLLFTKKKAKTETVRETLLDRAVISVIALELYDRGDYNA